ncbi:MAG: Arc family DNA-binding protein [Alysiella sp.]|uniref:Arc family DNA-binding protein n=1 Tax=Alysiella sp. TaxID=1872483 RepID=UPI0026DD12DC|nr:Arc family DNA-binding protein [Alysiella sp.]MDO4434379.1 Arc family DNA-binding protein [Alysiella sp.]
MARNDPQVNFRLPLDLKEKLEQAAKVHGRSLTSELITRLEQSFAENQSSSDTMAMFQKILDEIQTLKK